MTQFGVQDSFVEASFDPVAEAKLLLRTARSAALATLVAESGHPFATLVNVANAPDGSPILLLSELSAHRRYLAADPRLSLLFYIPGRGDPLAHPRLTILGRAQRVDEAERRSALRTRFLARHPKSALYADFPDFSFFHVEMENVHLNGGFARAASLSAQQIRTPIADAGELIAAEADALDHIGKDHADFAPVLARVRGGTADDGPWRVIGLDPEGVDLGSNEKILRVPFERPVTTMNELRQNLVELGKQARRSVQT